MTAPRADVQSYPDVGRGARQAPAPVLRSKNRSSTAAGTIHGIAQEAGIHFALTAELVQVWFASDGRSISTAD